MVTMKNVWFLLVLQTLIYHSQGQNVTTEGPDGRNGTDCAHNKADIVFLLDASSSEGSTNFKKQLDFVLNFTDAYEIGPDHVQVSVVTFSTSTHNSFYLNEHQDKQSLLAAIRNVKYTGGTTYTNVALKYVRENSYLPSHGGRYGVPKILVVLTDGQSTSSSKTIQEANILKYGDIKVISIGIGSGVSKAELSAIATDAQHMFTVPSFNSLQLIEKEIQTAACVSEKFGRTLLTGDLLYDVHHLPIGRTPGEETTCEFIENCDDKQADIVFVLDASGSEGKTNFVKQLEFVANFTDKFNIGPNAVQISLVTFSGSVYNEFFLNAYSNKDDIKNAVANATYIGTTTDTAEALKFVRENSFKPENGGRGNGVSQLAIVLTDGQSDSHSLTVSEATKLHHTGIRVISVGIGGSVDSTELTDMATDTAHVFNVKDFDALGSIQTQIERAACTTPLVCGSKPTDVVFILDSSSSEGATNFQKQLDFVSSFAKQFDIGPSDVQVGLVTFSYSAHNEFYLNGYKDKLSLLAAIQGVNYRSGSTHTDQGLRYARYYQFASYHGARSNANKVAIVLTDGRSYDISRTVQEAQQLKNTGVTVIAVGIGADVNQYEINSIATDRQHAFTVGSFDILHTLLEDIKDESCGAGKPAPTPNPECGNKPADIVFVLDSSASEGSSNFQKQLDFVRDFVYQFKIGPQDVQASIVRFSSSAREIFPLNKYSDQASLLKGIAGVTYSSGATYTDKALKLVREGSFNASNGARPNATHIVVVITDGQSTYADRTEKEAFLLKNSTSVDLVVAIGIGSGVKHDELVKIASDQTHALAVANFNALQTLNSELTFVTCNTCNFLSKADIVFILDASSSEGATHFQKQLDFVSRTVNDFKIGPTGVQIGVLTFATSTNLEFYLNQYSTKAQVLSQIQGINYSGGTTHTAEALNFARNDMFTSQHGDRADANNFVIILTDGASSNSSATLQAANSLKQQNTQVIVIGIGDNINKAEVEGMASDKSHVFEVASFDALRTIREDLKLAGCETVTTTSTIPTTTTTSTTTTTTTPRPTTTSTTTTPKPTTTSTTTTPVPTTSTTTAIPTTTFGFDCQYENQTTTDPRDCSRYYRCTAGKLLHETCPDGDYFNPSDFLCEDKQHVLCTASN